MFLVSHSFCLSEMDLPANKTDSLDHGGSNDTGRIFPILFNVTAVDLFRYHVCVIEGRDFVVPEGSNPLGFVCSIVIDSHGFVTHRSAGNECQMSLNCIFHSSLAWNEELEMVAPKSDIDIHVYVIM